MRLAWLAIIALPVAWGLYDLARGVIERRRRGPWGDLSYLWDLYGKHTIQELSEKEEAEYRDFVKSAGLHD
jgi:hypothetical protein